MNIKKDREIELLEAITARANVLGFEYPAINIDLIWYQYPGKETQEFTLNWILHELKTNRRICVYGVYMRANVTVATDDSQYIAKLINIRGGHVVREQVLTGDQDLINWLLDNVNSMKIVRENGGLSEAQ